MSSIPIEFMVGQHDCQKIKIEWGNEKWECLELKQHLENNTQQSRI